jgi:hypothetical protein
MAIAAGTNHSFAIRTICTPGEGSCDDNNVCTTDFCDPTIGTCVYTYNHKPCDDGLYCTKPDRCENGLCVGTPRNCPPGRSCDEDQRRCVPVE